jgi:hypothetical protein
VSLDKRALSVYHAVKLGNDFQPSSVRSLASQAEKIYQRSIHQHSPRSGTWASFYSHQGQAGRGEEDVPTGTRRIRKCAGCGAYITLSTVGNLGLLYADQGKLDETEKMYSLCN